ncbi:MAG: alanyl-tRNA editing protein [Candidatus Heimdallarchaeota archaeon]|nr:alanyl-tRNA editing protein [Candidatus Heimdallarchaeota archaeon]
MRKVILRWIKDNYHWGRILAQTKMLYMEDNYIKSFEAEVIAVGENYVILDQTAFYPEGGGQESDIGTLLFGNQTITISMVKRDSGEVRHYIEDFENLPVKGETVTCNIDWEKRLIHMRYHTAVHVLSTFMKEHYNTECVGNNISTRNGRADFNLIESLTGEDLKKIENGINEIIAKNLPVKITFMPRDDAIKYLEEKGYQTDYIQMVPKSVKTFRVISVNDYDHASCAGTHVKNTSEIGKVKVVKRRSMGKGKERITLAFEEN